MTLVQLKHAPSARAIQEFRPDMNVNHIRQALCIIDFCNHYQLQFLHPAPAIICYYMTHLTTRFTTANSIYNYVSGIQFLHKQLGQALKALDSFPVMSLLGAVDLTMSTPLLHHLPILPHLL